MAEQPKPFNQRVYEGYVQPFVDRVLTPAIDAVGYYVPPGTRKQVAGLADLFATPDTVTPTRNALAALGEGRYGLAATEGANALLAPLMITPMAPELLAMRAAAAGPRMSNMLARRPAAPAPEPPGITAYHGSPHDFDAFDMSRIGTGEGAQAYGHGLYFAESPAVAGQYKAKLADRPDVIVGGSVVPPENDVVAARLASLVKGRASLGTPRASAADVAAELEGEINRQLQRAVESGDFEAFKSLTDQKIALDRFKTQGIEFADKGRLYGVRIKAEPDQFLDWDKPLSQQPERIQTALAPLGYKADRGAMKSYTDDLLAALEGDATKPLGKQPSDPRGEDIVRALYKQKGSSWLNPNTAAERHQSQALLDAGIPGIRYLDQGSRGTGVGTYNYVVFDDGLIQIVSKDGKLIPQPSPNPAARSPVMPQQVPQPGLRYNALAAGVLPSYDGGR